MRAKLVEKQKKLLDTLKLIEANKENLALHPSLVQATQDLKSESNRLLLDTFAETKKRFPLAFTPVGQDTLEKVKQAMIQLNNLSLLYREISDKLQNHQLDAQSYQELENIRLAIAKVTNVSVLEIEKFLQMILTRK